MKDEGVGFEQWQWQFASWRIHHPMQIATVDSIILIYLKMTNRFSIISTI